MKSGKKYAPNFDTFVFPLSKIPVMTCFFLKVLSTSMVYSSVALFNNTKTFQRAHESSNLSEGAHHINREQHRLAKDALWVVRSGCMVKGGWGIRQSHSSRAACCHILWRCILAFKGDVALGILAVVSISRCHGANLHIVATRRRHTRSTPVSLVA